MILHIGWVMKNKDRLTGIIAIAAFIGLTLMSCNNLLEDLLTQTVETPIADPPAGTYTSEQMVYLHSSTIMVNIYYTTDGSTPTTGSTRYSTSITISTPTTLKAIAVRDGMHDSGILTAFYNIREPYPETVEEPTTDPPEGIYTDTQTVTLTCATSGASIYYTTNGYTPTVNSTPYTGAITISKTTTLKAIAVKDDMNNSSILNVAYIINDPQLETVETPIADPPAGTYNSTQKVGLFCLESGASIYYTTDGATPTASSTYYRSESITISKTTTLKVVAVKDGMNNSDVLTAVYSIYDPQLATVATPAASLPEGTYPDTQTVTLTCTESGASIYYTTNGYTPTAGSALYTGAITISQTTTLKAIAVKSGMNNSNVLTAVYTIKATPTVTPVTSWRGLTVSAGTTALRHNSYQGKSDVLHIAPRDTGGYSWNVLSYSLFAYSNQSITITVSMDVWLDVSTKVAWQVNQWQEDNNDFLVICGSTSTMLETGKWVTVSGTTTITPMSSNGNMMYLSRDQLVGDPVSIGDPPGNVEMYITGFTVSVDEQVVNVDPDDVL